MLNDTYFSANNFENVQILVYERISFYLFLDGGGASQKREKKLMIDGGGGKKLTDSLVGRSVLFEKVISLLCVFPLLQNNAHKERHRHITRLIFSNNFILFLATSSEVGVLWRVLPLRPLQVKPSFKLAVS